jgi:hypothetical protein
MVLAPFFFLLNLDVKADKAWFYHHKRSDYYFHKGNYPEMLYHAKEMVKWDPKDVETWSSLGYYYWSMSVDNKDKKDLLILDMTDNLERFDSIETPLKKEIKELHNAGMIHISEWKMNKTTMLTRIYKWGPGEDAQEPAITYTNNKRNLFKPHADVAAACLQNSI